MPARVPEVDDGNCIAIIGDCIDDVPIEQAWVVDDAFARVEMGSGGAAPELEGLEIGVARLVADLTWQGRSVRKRLAVEVLEAERIEATRGEELLSADSVLTMRPGEELTFQTVLWHGGGTVQGEGLHTLHNPDGLLILHEDGTSEHWVVAGEQLGRAEVTAELSGATLFQVEITDAP